MIKQITGCIAFAVIVTLALAGSGNSSEILTEGTRLIPSERGDLLELNMRRSADSWNLKVLSPSNEIVLKKDFSLDSEDEINSLKEFLKLKTEFLKLTANRIVWILRDDEADLEEGVSNSGLIVVHRFESDEKSGNWREAGAFSLFARKSDPITIGVPYGDGWSRATEE